MKKVAITQRVSIVTQYHERRDCLDQAWPRFLAACGLMSLALPNVIEVAMALCTQDLIGRIVDRELRAPLPLAQYVKLRTREVR